MSRHQDEHGNTIVRFRLPLAHGSERVWKALTSEPELAVWYPTEVKLTLITGGVISFRFPAGEPFEGEVLEAKAPHRLTFTTRDDVLRWEICPAPHGSVLVLQYTVAEHSHTPYTAAGFHISLSQLQRHLDHGPAAVKRVEMPPPQDLVDKYADLLGLDC